MESLGNYLTGEGWARDLEETIQRHPRIARMFGIKRNSYEAMEESPKRTIAEVNPAMHNLMQPEVTYDFEAASNSVPLLNIVKLADSTRRKKLLDVLMHIGNMCKAPEDELGCSKEDFRERIISMNFSRGYPLAKLMRIAFYEPDEQINSLAIELIRRDYGRKIAGGFIAGNLMFALERRWFRKPEIIHIPDGAWGFPYMGDVNAQPATESFSLC